MILNNTNSSKKKILMVIPTLSGGGAERVFNNLANSFVTKNVDVILITNYQNKYDKNISSLINLITPRKKRLKNRYLERLLRLIITFIAIIKTIIKHKPSCIISTLDEANFLTYMALFCVINNKKNIKFVYREANIIIPERYQGFMGLLAKKVENRSNHVIANSYDTKESLIKVFDIEPEKITVIGNPVYQNKIIEESYDEEIITAFSKVLKRVPDIKLIILGTGSLEKELKMLCEELNMSDSVCFFGFSSNPYPFYRLSELFVLSSIYEGFGNVLVEALSFGKPVVSINCKGGPSFILEEGKYGSLVEVGNINSFADKMVDVLTKKEVFLEVSQIKRAKEFGIDHIADSYLDILCN